MEGPRDDGRSAAQLRSLSCSRSFLHRAHGSASWSQGFTKILAAVYGPKAGAKKNENPEKACFEVIWKPRTGQVGKAEKEYEMIVKRTIQSICVLNMNPNTTTSVIVQVVQDDGSLLVCAINAVCAALADAGIPMKSLAVAVCCCLTEMGHVIVDPTKLEEKNTRGFTHLVFPNFPKSVISADSELKEQGLITSVTRGVMSVDEYLDCVDIGRTACAKLSEFVRRSLCSSPD